MGAKKKRLQNEGTPFAQLAKEIEKDLEPVDLQSMVRTFDVRRNSKREPIKGAAVICDSRGRVVSKAEFKNLSLTGVSLEIWPIKIKVTDDIYVHFNNSLTLGLVLCTVQWVTDIAGHRRHHKLVGLKFKEMPEVKQKKLDEYIAKLQSGRQHDPFYGSS